ncbi:MAG TPA: HNH endonuclease, partial [Anaeromyxobacter sp.]|nr:HNH endonuclease [Anaeromyxobacter sp.]
DGLLALSVGDRAMRLGGWSSVKDYGRERLDLQDRTVQNLLRLARGLRTRPLLRAAVRSGELSIRKAEVILPVAYGDAEARWVALARDETVRALEVRVRESADPDAGDDAWHELRVPLPPERRAVVDEALALAGDQLGRGSTRAQRLEALAQEYLGGHPVDAGDGDLPASRDGFRALGERPGARLEALEAQLERETERWGYLDEVQRVPAVEDGLSEEGVPRRIGARLEELATLRKGWDRQLGYFALILQRSRLWSLLGFASFAHYCKERLGLSKRAVEQRAALERRLWELPVLRRAVEEGLPYEKARLLSRLETPADVEAWLPRAATMTVIALRRALEAADDAQMRSRRVLVVRMPSRTAALLAAAFRAVREAEGPLLSPSECLERLARHFIAVWKPRRRRRTRSQAVRDRDLGWCIVPGCSRPAADSHHILFRSRGGGDELPNQGSLCKPHHLRGVHQGYIHVWGRAPDGLTWELGERVSAE